MSFKLNSDASGRRYLIFVAAGLTLIGFLAWHAFDGISWTQEKSPPGPNSPGSQIPEVKTAPITHQEALSQFDRSLELNLPAIGTVKGARWIRNVGIPQPDGKTFPPLDVLVDEEGRFLTARRGDEAFASHPNMDVYWKVLKQQTSNTEGLNKRVKSVRHLPLPWPGNEAESGIANAGGRGELTDQIKLHIWVPVVVEFHDEPVLYATMLSIRTYGKIFESRLHPEFAYEEGLSPYKHLYKPTVVAGANRFATMVKVTTGFIPGLQAPYAEYNPVGYGGLFLTEPWSGSSPWRDDQMDPVFGERRADESYIPDDNALNYRLLEQNKNWAYGYYRKGDGTVGVPTREAAEARYQARLAREAAEKGK